MNTAFMDWNPFIASSVRSLDVFDEKRGATTKSHGYVSPNLSPVPIGDIVFILASQRVVVRACVLTEGLAQGR